MFYAKCCNMFRYRRVILKVGGIKYVNVDVHSCNCVQNFGLCQKLDIMHSAFSSKLYKTILN
jgi:hypothetical protein